MKYWKRPVVWCRSGHHIKCPVVSADRRCPCPCHTGEPIA